VADAIPTTQKGQIDALIFALGVSDVTAALAAIPTLISSAATATQWQEQRQTLFAALGGSSTIPEHYDFAAGIAGMKTSQTALFEKLGVTDQAGAILALDNLSTESNNLKAVQTSIFGALKATDHAGAMRAITDIDGRIEAGVKAGVIARAASAGLTAPIEKLPGDQKPAGANTTTRAEFASMNPKQQLEFSQAGGKLLDEAAA
jgi:hypothetical protein